MARDRDPIPTSRIGRLNKIGRLAAGQAARQFGTRAANVVRDDESSQAALERRQIAAAEQIVTVLGTMKGAAMKLGQVLSFLDVGLVPESYREEFQAKLAELRDAAPKVSFKDMKRVLEGEYGDSLDEVFATFDPVPIAAASICRRSSAAVEASSSRTTLAARVPACLAACPAASLPIVLSRRIRDVGMGSFSRATGSGKATRDRASDTRARIP